jgi:branched-chain amino acid transport system permease protein
VIRVVFDVLSNTSMLVLLTLGLGLIAGMMGVFNMAHGELVLLGAWISYEVNRLGGSPWLALILAPLVAAIFGVVLERLVVRHLYVRPLHAILATWALGIAMRGLVSKSLKTTARSVPYPVEGTVSIMGTTVSLWRLILLLATPVLIVLLYLLLSRSSHGLRIRAALENPELARLSGIRTSWLYAATFALGSALAALAGAMIAPLTSVYPTMGVGFLIDSFLALMIGGLGSIESAVVGAGAVGITGGTVRYHVSPAIASAVVLGIAVVVARLRPNGLLKR